MRMRENTPKQMNQKNMEKSLSKKQIKEGWRIVKFGEIAKNISVRVDPLTTVLKVYVGLEHLDTQSLRIARRGVPTDVKGQKLRVRPGQIIFGKRRAYQKKLAVADFDGICSAHAMVLEAVPGKIIPELLPFLMQSDMFMDRAVAISEGSLSPTIKWKILAIQKFPLPPLDRQKDILEVLNTIQKNIEIKNHMYDSLQILFNTFCFNHIFNVSKKLQNVKTKSVSCFINKLEPGKSVKSSAQYAKPNEVGILKVSSVSGGNYRPHENKTVIDTFEIKKLNIFPKKGDWLITRANTKELVGDICRVDVEEQNKFIPDKIWRVQLNSNIKFDYNWLFFTLLAMNRYGETGKIASGTSGSMKNISQKKYMEMKISVPMFESQTRIGTCLNELFTSIQNIRNDNSMLQKLRQKVFMKLLTSEY